MTGAQHAGWYPDKNVKGQGWNESNINVLTENPYESCDPEEIRPRIETRRRVRDRI